MQGCRLDLSRTTFMSLPIYRVVYNSLQLSTTVLNCLEMQCCRLDLSRTTFMSLPIYRVVYNSLQLSTTVLNCLEMQCCLEITLMSLCIVRMYSWGGLRKD
jgi:hypothetical protein